MSLPLLILTLALLTAFSYFLGRKRSLQLVSGNVQKLHSLPGHYGWYTALGFLLPAVTVLFLWLAFGSAVIDKIILSALSAHSPNVSPDTLHLMLNDVHNIASGNHVDEAAEPTIVKIAEQYNRLHKQGFLGAALLAVGAGFLMALAQLRAVAPELRARNRVERILVTILVICSVFAILTTIGIVFSLIFETVRFFEKVPVHEFLFSLTWSPQTAMRADQVGSSGSFGAVPLIAGTLLITFIAMMVAVPVGLMSAIYMTQYASGRFRAFAKPLLEVLAGVPTVVYGFFAALVVAPAVRDGGTMLGLSVASESALAAGAVMGIMIIPFMSSLSDDAIASVPRTMRDGSLALGATPSETIRRVLIPAALPGIVGAFLLSVSRAIGETMIVVMAAGLAANLTANPLQAVTTVTAQIVSLLTGDQEFDSAKTLSAFALGLVLFTVTLSLNIIALRVVRKYRETYE